METGGAPSVSGPGDHVLVTGAGGLIGSVVCDALGDEYAVRGLDVVRGSHVHWRRDLRKLRKVEPAFEGVSAVVDLAADGSPSASWPTVLGNNIAVTLNTLEAARRRGARRVVLGSSNRVVGLYEREEPYASVVAGAYAQLDPTTLPRLGVDVPVRPDSPYGVGKVFSETAARHYADVYGLSVICIRIGTVNPDDRPMRPRHFATLLTHRDLVDLVRRSLTAPLSISYAVVYGVSANTWRIWDIDHGRNLIGFEPQDNAESFRTAEAAGAT